MVWVVAGIGASGFSYSTGVGWSLKSEAGRGRKERDYGGEILGKGGGEGGVEPDLLISSPAEGRWRVAGKWS